MTEDIKIREASAADADFIGEAVCGALGEELCSDLAGSKEKIEVVYHLFSRLAASDDAQYSYRNTLVAVNLDNKPVGAIIGYDGSILTEARKLFIDLANELLNWDISYQEAENWEAETSEKEVYLDSLYVVPQYRCKGVASALINAAIKRYHHLGKPFGLLVEPSNENAYRLYKSLGFENDGNNSFCGVSMKHLTLRQQNINIF